MTTEVKLYQKSKSSNLYIKYLYIILSQCINFFLFHFKIAREKRKGQHDVQWLKTILTSGTLSDKMAAMTLIIQV